MSTADKLKKRILEDPPREDITYKEAESFLLDNGFTKKPQGGGSHVHFTHPKFIHAIGLVTNTKTLKRSYIKNIKDAIEEIENK